MSLRARILSGENPRRLRPTPFRPKIWTGRMPATLQKGGTSWVTTVKPPVKAKRPIRQNWWTPVKPESMA